MFGASCWAIEILVIWMEGIWVRAHPQIANSALSCHKGLWHTWQCCEAWQVHYILVSQKVKKNFNHFLWHSTSIKYIPPCSPCPAYIIYIKATKTTCNMQFGRIFHMMSTKSFNRSAIFFLPSPLASSHNCQNPQRSAPAPEEPPETSHGAPPRLSEVRQRSTGQRDTAMPPWCLCLWSWGPMSMPGTRMVRDAQRAASRGGGWGVWFWVEILWFLDCF